MNAPSTLLRERLLLAMLDVAPQRGWNESALAEAARRDGLTVGEAALAAPGGALDLADAFALWADDQMAARLRASGLETMKVRAKATLAVRARLEALAPHKESVRRAAAALALAGVRGPAARIGWRTADRMWREIGDTSTDENFYSKRAILMAVHGATLARFLLDPDPTAQDTWAFLDTQIQGVMNFEKLKARLAPLTQLGDAAAAGLARMRYGFGRP